MPESTRRATNTGLGRTLVAVYAIFAISASARSLVQLTQRAGEAPLAYGLSALAAAVYVVATVSLARPGPRATPVAWAAVLVELVGVIGVGALSFARPELFPEPTVWSHLGEGYGYVPLVLPFLGLAWLRHTRGHTPGHTRSQ